MPDKKVSGIMSILRNQPQVNQGEAGELSRWLSSQQKCKLAPDWESYCYIWQMSGLSAGLAFCLFNPMQKSFWNCFKWSSEPDGDNKQW